MTIYLSLFDQCTLNVASALEALVATNVRRALGMFADILVSPHIPTNLITGTILTGASRIQNHRVADAAEKQVKSSYIRNIMDVDLDHNQPSNFYTLTFSNT